LQKKKENSQLSTYLQIFQAEILKRRSVNDVLKTKKVKDYHLSTCYLAFQEVREGISCTKENKEAKRNVSSISKIKKQGNLHLPSEIKARPNCQTSKKNFFWKKKNNKKYRI